MIICEYNMSLLCKYIYWCYLAHLQWCSWNHLVFRVFHHHTPSSRRPSSDWSDPSLCPVGKSSYPAPMDLLSWAIAILGLSLPLQWSCGRLLSSLYQCLTDWRLRTGIGLQSPCILPLLGDTLLSIRLFNTPWPVPNPWQAFFQRPLPDGLLKGL